MSGVEYHEYLLPASSNNYINQQMQYPKALCRKLLNLKSISGGKKIAFLPDNLPLAMIEDRYVGGGIAYSEVTRNWLAQNIQKYLMISENNLVILEHAAARPNDPWIERKKQPINSFNEEVYLSLSANDAKELDYIEQTIKNAETAWRLFGVMSSLPKIHLPLAKVIDNNTIEMLAERSEQLIFSAFDGEGYIICSFDH